MSNKSMKNGSVDAKIAIKQRRRRNLSKHNDYAATIITELISQVGKAGVEKNRPSWWRGRRFFKTDQNFEKVSCGTAKMYRFNFNFFRYNFEFCKKKIQFFLKSYELGKGLSISEGGSIFSAKKKQS